MTSTSKIKRCPWPGIEDPTYRKYHDEEWGVPLTDSRKLFEKLVLEGFQAGLSWLIILKKRENFRNAFHQFDAKLIARYNDKDIKRLMNDAGIVRNRLKIEATIDNAKAYLELEKRMPFAHFIWSFIDNKPRQNKIKAGSLAPASTDQSKILSKALKSEGFRFVGPTTVYAFMQSSGMVNDHVMTCSRYKQCKKLQTELKIPGR
ncbi:MAG: DNA-3-methyladenine glycosylase I [Hyphomicrobium sp.]|nr:MAG: DNA-3-methyladenine glycosylase I [Hyphomicrobium sp.]PPD01432.1 MAG: DNA-3-methyladenine glycosylase I [Hyphomicrobium sp.]